MASWQSRQVGRVQRSRNHLHAGHLLAVNRMQLLSLSLHHTRPPSFLTYPCLFASVNGVIDGTDIIYRDYCDISIAVATPKGLVVPVLRDADKLDFAGVERVRALGQGSGLF